MRESTIERYLVKSVKAIGGIAFKFVSPQRRGVPDRIVLLRGKAFFVELKAPGCLPTEEQIRMHQTFRLLGFTVIVFDNKHQIDLFIERIRDA